MNELLSDTARESLLTPLFDTGWSMVADRDAIAKDFAFKDFTEAFAWMTRAALWAEKWNHHPEWCNTYNRVSVTLTTHDCGGLSALDLTLARRMDKIAGAAEVQKDHSEPVACLCELHAKKGA